MATTILHRLNDWAQASPEAPAQRYKTKNGWSNLTAEEYRNRVVYLALFLQSKGIQPKDIGAILSYNCKEWVHLELAIMLIGARSTGLYPNSTSKDIHYILNHTESLFLAVQNKTYWDRLQEKGGQIPSRLKFILVIDGDTSISPLAISYEAAIEEGKSLAKGKTPNEWMEHFLKGLDPFEPAFLIYTSGTTGNPKGAVLSHDNLTYTSDLIAKRWNLPFEAGSLFSFLPLCHIAEKLHSIGVGITQRYLTTYCTKFENVSIELQEAEPTLLLCVPRVWEKMMETVVSKLGKVPPLKKALATWAMKVGGEVTAAKMGVSAPNPLNFLLKPIADKIILEKVKAAMGLRRAHLLASGAAPLPAHVSRWFRNLGLEILECYGLTETTGVVSVTLPGKDCAGTVGKPLEGTEFKLEEDGEICTKGRHVFLGYFRDEDNTRQSLINGWLHTGDLGKFTSEGYLKIIGRKRDIMKSSGGKMIAPSAIEEKFKEADFISQACLVGDNRKYFAVILTLSESVLNDLKNKPGAFKNGVVEDAKILEETKNLLAKVNKDLASYEQVKRFSILDREFSIENAEMTPTLKMKRSTIETVHKDLIDQMYV